MGINLAEVATRGTEWPLGDREVVALDMPHGIDRWLCWLRKRGLDGVWRKWSAANGRDRAGARPLPVKQTGWLRAKAGVNPRDLIKRLLNGTTRKRGEVCRTVEAARDLANRGLEVGAGGWLGSGTKIISEG